MPVIGCPSCGAKLKVPDTTAGKKVACPSCKQVIVVPASEMSADAITEQPSPPSPAAAPILTGATDEDRARADNESEDRPRRQRQPAEQSGGKPWVIILIVVGIVGVLGCGGLAILMALLVPAVAKVREAAARTQTSNNMKQLALGQYSYNNIFNSFPTPRVTTPNGQPVDLSWRVSLLPFVEYQPLSETFDKNGAWDKPQNRPLLNPMPAPFGDLFRPVPEDAAATRFQYFTGAGTPFPANNRVVLHGIPDGASNTFNFAEAATPVPWSKGADMTVAPNQPLPLPPDNRFLAALFDGSVRLFDHVPEAVLRSAINPNDGGPPPGALP